MKGTQQSMRGLGDIVVTGDSRTPGLCGVMVTAVMEALVAWAAEGTVSSTCLVCSADRACSAPQTSPWRDLGGEMLNWLLRQVLAGEAWFEELQLAAQFSLAADSP